jgi:hypothetical protein
MAWTTPLTAVSNATLTAAQWNASVRDDLLLTAPALATTAGSIFVATGANTIAQRPVLSDTVTTLETTTSTAFTNLATVGPTITATTGSLGLLLYAAQIANNANGEISVVSWDITGASAVSAIDDNSINADQPAAAANQDIRMADVRRLTGLTPGSNTVTLKYRVSVGTSTGSFRRRHAILIGL